MTEETLLGRIRGITEAIRKAREGEFPFCVETSGKNDELDVLADEIRQMVESVHEHIVARKTAEEAQRDSKEKYRRLKANIPGMVYLFALHPDGTFSFPYVNDTSLELFDIPPEKLMGDATLITRLIHPDDRERFDTSVLRSAKKLEPWRQEIRHVVNGEVRWYDCMSRPELQPNGDILWDGIILEITERKQAEETLRRSEERFRSLVEATSDWIWEVNSRGAYTYASPKLKDILGYNPQEVIGKMPFDLMPPEEAERIRPRFAEVMNSGGSFCGLENVNLHKKGHEVTIETNGVPIFGADGKLCGYRGIGRDISERKRAEEALRDKTDELDRYFTQALDLLCIADTDGYFRRLNKEWVSALGYSISELEGSRFLDYVHPEDLNATLGAITQLGDQEEVLNFVNRYRAKDGSYRWIEWRSFPAGKLIYAVARDITERKRTENVMSARMRLLQFAATHTMDELLEATLDEAEALTESLIGFYVFLLADQKTLSLQNWSTRTKREFCKAEGKGLHYDISDAGVWVDCIHQRRPVIHNDYASIPHRKGLPPGHAPLIRELVVPVFRGENIVAILAVGNKTTDYTSRDVETVSLLADLAWSIVEKKRADEKVLSSLEEKTVLLKEVHHRVKNNMQIICSLFDLQSDSIMDEKTRDIFLDSQNRIRSMALVHEKLYQSESFAFINFEEYIDSLTQYLFNTLVKDPDLITLNVDAGDLSLEIDQAIPCGLIINELVSNSLKHAFPDERGGEITVRCHAKEDGLITLTVSDNGVGLSPDLDVGTTDTLGLQLMTMLVKQLQGHIELERDKGTAFTIQFRKSEFT